MSFEFDLRPFTSRERLAVLFPVETYSDYHWRLMTKLRRQRSWRDYLRRPEDLVMIWPDWQSRPYGLTATIVHWQ